MTGEGAEYLRSPELLSAATSRLVIVDVQEKFLPTIRDGEGLVANCSKLVRGAGILEVPVSCTEQYPERLGSTVPGLIELLPERCSKLRFSCGEALAWRGESGRDGRHQIVLAGIEAHVCVLQTALDLVSAGFEVYVAADAVRSRHLPDEELALRRLSDAGVRLVSTEMVLFEWCEVAGTDTFKQISRLVTGR